MAVTRGGGLVRWSPGAPWSVSVCVAVSYLGCCGRKSCWGDMLEVSSVCPGTSAAGCRACPRPSRGPGPAARKEPQAQAPSEGIYTCREARSSEALPSRSAGLTCTSSGGIASCRLHCLPAWT